MATSKIKFRTSSVAGREGTVYYQIIQNRTPRQIRTDYKLHASEWDDRNSEVLIPASYDEQRKKYLQKIQKNIEYDFRRLKSVISDLDKKANSYTADDVVQLYRTPSDDYKYGFVSYAQHLVIQLRKMGRFRLADTYTTSINSFMRFRLGEEVPWKEFDGILMQSYEQYMKNNGLCPNTTSYYMRNLRAIYNRAVEDGVCHYANPFRHVYTGIDKTLKRALSITDLQKIQNLDLTSDKAADLARDIYLFSFYTRGMSFIDIAYLKKKDLQNSVLTYRRQKTGQKLFIKWEKQMQDIVDKYDIADSPYLLPVIRDCSKDKRRQYLSALSTVNRKLGQIGNMLHLPVKLSTYTARHSWGSAAKYMNIPLSVISEAMGHDSEKTTLIYLASLDKSRVDDANSKIINSLR